MKSIDPKDISIDPASYVDPSGRVFKWEGSTYRAIALDRSHFFTHLVSEVIHRCPELRRAFVETEITDLTLDGYGLILKHRTISFPSYCVEWPPPILKEAALHTLRIASLLAQHGLMLQDAHPWNIFFEGPKPRFIDLGSVVPASEGLLWPAYDQFCHFFLYPLYLSAAGLSEVARSLLYDYINGISGELCRTLLPTSYKLRHPRTFSRLILPQVLTQLSRRWGFEDRIRSWSTSLGAGSDLAGTRQRFFEALLKEVEGIQLPRRSTEWSAYYTGPASSASTSDLTAKDETIRRVLQATRPETIFDMGCNVGRYAVLAATVGSRVVACDRDVTCVSLLYQQSRERNLDILPLVIDVANPTPAFGWCGRQYPSALDRFQVDMVFASALVHHLAIRQYHDFARIIGTLKAFTKRWLLVEFVGQDDPKARIMIARSLRDFSWYDLKSFMKALEQHFKKVKILESYSESRTLLLCE
ncbi:MAG: class I SAM-dependent methyltransferase [Candidatus Brocadiales bacterium]|nr:class I SAM-dependent methyltransferase [Candidatus Bathyanammoxibius sp.]